MYRRLPVHQLPRLLRVPVQRLPVPVALLVPRHLLVLLPAQLLLYRRIMITLTNSKEKGAPIKDFLFQKKMYALGLGETKTFDNPVANRLQQTYPWLEEVKLEGKFTCKYGDYANDYKVAVIQHEKQHTEEPKTEEGEEFVTPQEIADKERASRLTDPEGIPYGEGVDKDGVPWYGEGLQTDDEYMGSFKRKPGYF